MRDMNQHIVKPENDQSFHTSGYAVAANGNRIGSVSTMSFEQRQKLELNRQKIGGYNRSVIGRSFGTMRARPVADTDLTNRNAINQRPETPVTTAPRKYDPYA